MSRQAPDSSLPPQPQLAADWIVRSRLWLVLDEAAAAPRSLAEVTRQAIQGGVDAVLCRLKTQPPPRVYELALALRSICAELACPFVMSHHCALGLHLGADAVQLGQGDISLASARQLLGPGIRLGRSCHSLDEARAAFEQGADYVFLGPVYATPSKLAYGAPLGPAIVPVAEALPGPVVYIGGITYDNLGPLLEAGARRVAAIRALQGVDEVAEACWSIKAQMKMAQPDNSPAGP